MNNLAPPYQAWLHWDPTPKCNLACAYCFMRTGSPDSSYKEAKEKELFFFFNKQIKKIVQPPVDPINMDAALSTLEKTEKIFRISFTGGGEPFLVPNLAEFCGLLAQKHYVSFNTNLTSPHIIELTKKVPAKKMIYIIASLHYFELKKRGLLKTYINNYLCCKEAGYDIRTNEVAHPALKKKADALRKKLQHFGITLGFDPFIGYYQGKKYPEAYTPEEVDVFGLNIIKDNQTFFHQKGELCNAGYNIAYINNTGTVYQCPGIPRRIGHIYEKISLDTTLTKCTADFCACPMKNYDYPLYEQALQETNFLNSYPNL